MEFQKEEPKAKFNSGLAQLESIRKLKDFTHNAMIQQDLNGAVGAVLAYRREIWEFLSLTERIEVDAMTMTLTKKAEVYNANKAQGFMPLYVHIDRFMLRLNELNSKYGLSMVAKDRASDAADQ